MSVLDFAIKSFIANSKKGNYTIQWRSSTKQNPVICSLMDYIDSQSYEALSKKCTISVIWRESEPDWLATFISLSHADQEAFVTPVKAVLCVVCETRIDEKADIAIQNNEVVHRACMNITVKPPNETVWSLIMSIYDAFALCSKKVRGYRAQLVAERSKIMTIVDPMVAKFADAS